MRNAAKPDEKRAREAARKADADLLFVMSDERGRRFVWSELGRNGLHRQTYSPNNSEQSFNAGERNAAIKLNLDVMRVSPELYLTMQREAIEAAELEAKIDAAQAAEDNEERGYSDD